MVALNPSSLSNLQENGVAPAYATGLLYPNALFALGQTQAQAALAADLLVATPFYCRENVTMTTLAGYQHTNGAGVSARMGVYSNSAGRPTTLLADSGAVSFPASTGWRSGTISLAMTPGWYWLAIVFNGSGNIMVLDAATEAHQRRFLADFGATTGVAGTVAGLINALGVYGSHTYAALPASFPSITGYSGTVNQPNLWIGK